MSTLRTFGRPRRRARLWELFAIVAAPWLLAAGVVWASRSLEVDWTKAALWAVSTVAIAGAVALHGHVKAEASADEYAAVLLEAWATNDVLIETLEENAVAVCDDCPYRPEADR